MELLLQAPPPWLLSARCGNGTGGAGCAGSDVNDGRASLDGFVEQCTVAPTHNGNSSGGDAVGGAWLASALASDVRQRFPDVCLSRDIRRGLMPLAPSFVALPLPSSRFLPKLSGCISCATSAGPASEQPLPSVRPPLQEARRARPDLWFKFPEKLRLRRVSLQSLMLPTTKLCISAVTLLPPLPLP